MGVNAAERGGVDNALTNAITGIQGDILDMKTKPQPIGNGSINYGIFSANLTWSGTLALGGGGIAVFTALLFDPAFTFTFNGLPAVNTATMLDFYYTVSVDTNTTAFDYPVGASLTSGQKNMQTNWWKDLAQSGGFTSGTGQQRIYIQVQNNDTSTHTYYLRANALYFRPALKPQ
jgi:hypothetical protein